ncbi:site-specific integrase [Paenibacillus sp. R14(2021)]|uniref:tyrosine-type recombinase/integrase n=1 Tax=Paenibacillus sp. R14(2021) TaxID=2859228 RepID=UPI001C616380|nr:site-specific integrase [Paenibacillus sp. R14(2021)]
MNNKPNYPIRKLNTKGAVIEMLSSMYNLSANDESISLSNETDTGFRATAINNWLFENIVLPSFASKKLHAYFKIRAKKCSPDNYFRLIRGLQILMNDIAKEQKLFSKDLDDAALQDHILFQRAADAANSDTTIRYLKLLFRLYFRKEKPEWFHLQKKSRNIPALQHPTILSHLATLKGVSKKTIQERKRAYFRFLSWATTVYADLQQFNPDSVPLYQVKNEHLVEFGAYLKQKVLSDDLEPSHANYIQGFVINLFQSLYQESKLLDDITEGIRKIKYEKYLYRDIPTNDEISRLFTVIETYAPNPKLYRLAFECMLYLGLRKIEVSSLRWENFNTRGWPSVKIYGKGGRVDVLLLPHQIVKTLSQLKNPDLKGNIFGLVPSSFADSLYVYYRIFSKIAGWRYPGGLHLLRHTYVTKLSKEECTPKLLKYLGRFSKSETASRYIHRSTDELGAAMKKFNLFGNTETFRVRHVTSIHE